MLALLAVPGVLVAGITWLIDAYWRRHRRELLGELGAFRLSDIADEAQRWLDSQA